LKAVSKSACAENVKNKRECMQTAREIHGWTDTDGYTDRGTDDKVVTYTFYIFQNVESKLRNKIGLNCEPNKSAI
jgi:hypothetical protein